MNSDESDFYGNPDTKADLQARVDAFDVMEWQQSPHPGHPTLRPNPPSTTTQLFNPYAGLGCSWEVTETVPDFLKRLPPSTTTRDCSVPWIYIGNPHMPQVPNTPSRALGGENELEAPLQSGSNLGVLMEGGEERLQMLKRLLDMVSMTDMPYGAKEREVRNETMKAVLDILELAHAAKVRPGKWMLFCSPEEVDGVWELVARATANNELGIAAKVAPKQAHDPLKSRLICVYTADFSDKTEVGQVLRKLREMRVVDVNPRDQRVYYKPDAFTYLGIASGNPWGVRPWIYSSKDKFP